MADKRPIVTLTTDFGEADYFVPAVKGSILAVNPEAELVDITHLIPPHDIYAAAFTLMCCYKDFPRWTTHVAVVDPGVGSPRRPIMVMTDEYNFIGPDNGIFSYVYQRETVNRIVHLNVQHYYRVPTSKTFHGRDIFGPCAGYVSKLVDWRKMGEEISDPVKFNIPTPAVLPTGEVRGHVLHIDRFGNVITNISQNELPEDRASAGARVRIGKHEAARVLTHFAEAGNNELFAYFGSAGLLEIAVSRQPAARLTEARRGMEVEVVLPS
ncbi:MAG TPA: SAM-dependent chlorinase/fluorinase [Blastocatellia bacterium]|nr:SAM-dependent chlorinase/fluorinase [Blastocatellia bacterium]